MLTQTFPSSSGAKDYTARFDPTTGQSFCDCPGWRFVKAGQPRGCKHTRALALTASDVPPAPRVTPSAPTLATATQVLHVSPLPRRAASLAPMLASAPTSGLVLAHYPSPAWILEEKIDGHRTLITRLGDTVTATSRPRAGQTHGHTQTLPPALVQVLALLPPGVYDGELCTPGGKSWDVARLDTPKVIVLFDVLALLGQSVVTQTYAERRGLLLVAVEHCGLQDVVTVSPAQPVSQAAIDALFARGAEGAILKRVASTYQPGVRSADWIKIKSLIHLTGTIIGFKAGASGPYSVLELRLASGVETRVKTKNAQWIRDIAKDPQAFVGRRLVIQAQTLTDEGKPRHPMADHFAADHE